MQSVVLPRKASGAEVLDAILFAGAATYGDGSVGTGDVEWAYGSCEGCGDVSRIPKNAIAFVVTKQSLGIKIWRLFGAIPVFVSPHIARFQIETEKTYERIDFIYNSEPNPEFNIFLENLCSRLRDPGSPAKHYIVPGAPGDGMPTNTTPLVMPGKPGSLDGIVGK